MTLADRTDASADASGAIAAEALIEEARHRQRRRWGGWIAGLAALALVAGVLVAVFGGTGGARGARASGSEGEHPFGTCSPCTPQSSASALARGHWVNLPSAPIATRMDEAAVWTGHRLVIWGGAGPYDNVTYANGAAYDPATRRWRMLPPSPLGPRWGVTAVWTGKEVFIWGGTGSGTGWSGPTLRDGALYDPTTHRWTLVPPAPIPTRTGATAIWTGHEVVLFGGLETSRNVGWLPAQRTDGATYDPTTRRWQRIPPLSAVNGEQGVMADQIAWNGQAVVATAVVAQHAPSMPLDGYRATALSARWTPGERRWHLVPSPPIAGEGDQHDSSVDGHSVRLPSQHMPDNRRRRLLRLPPSRQCRRVRPGDGSDDVAAALRWPGVQRRSGDWSVDRACRRCRRPSDRASGRLRPVRPSLAPPTGHAVV